MKKLNIVIFEDKAFLEITKADNPAYQPNTECVLVCKQSESKTPYKNAGRYVVYAISPVAHPDEEDTVSYLGLFWEFNDALVFARIKANDEVLHVARVNEMCIESLPPELGQQWEKIVKMLEQNRGLPRYEG